MTETQPPTGGGWSIDDLLGTQPTARGRQTVSFHQQVAETAQKTNAPVEDARALYRSLPDNYIDHAIDGCADLPAGTAQVVQMADGRRVLRSGPHDPGQDWMEGATAQEKAEAQQVAGQVMLEAYRTGTLTELVRARQPDADWPTIRREAEHLRREIEQTIGEAADEQNG